MEELVDSVENSDSPKVSEPPSLVESGPDGQSLKLGLNDRQGIRTRGSLLPDCSRLESQESQESDRMAVAQFWAQISAPFAPVAWLRQVATLRVAIHRQDRRCVLVVWLSND